MRKIKNFNKINLNNIQIMIMFLFFIMTLNLFGLKMYYLSAVMALTLFFYKIKKIDKISIVLIIFSIVYFFNYQLFFQVELSSFVVYLFGPWVAWFIGKALIQKTDNKEKMLYYIATILMLGLFSYGMLNLIKFLQINGIYDKSRITYDFWNNQKVAATGNGLLFTGLSSMAMGCLFFSKNTKYKILSIIVIGISFISSSLYQNRTLLLILFILFSIGIFLKLLEPNTYTKVRKIITFSIVLLLIAAIGYKLGWLSIIQKSTIYQRFETSNNDRLRLQIEFLKQNPFKYPLGGKNIKFNVGWVHNLWLDMWNDVGFLPFILFTYYTYIVVKNIIYVLFINKKTNLNVIAFLLMGQLINFMVEPIMSANHLLFIVFIIISSAFINSIEEIKKYKLVEAEQI